MKNFLQQANALASTGNNIVTAGATLGGKELIKLLINSFVKPKLENLSKKTQKNQSTYLNLEDGLKEYLLRSYDSHLYMNTIVFKNLQKTIDELYIPLTVIKCDELGKHQNISFYIDTYIDEFIPKYKKVLLVDTAGMGKSTIIKYLYINTIRKNKGIPILIELRKLDNNISIIDFILNEMNAINKEFEKKDILDLIKEGDFIFFFDGFDEIIPEFKTIITKNLQDFISKSSNNLFVLSSREEAELSSFGDFQKFDIKSLNEEEAFSLIKKYDNNDELSKELILKISTQENLKILNEFLENPLMVSLLYKAFEYKKTIPYKKYIFYRQVYDALFEEHDLSKGGAFKHTKKSQLDLADFHTILSTIGFLSLKQGVSYSEPEFSKIINKAKEKNSNIKFSTSNFIFDIIHSVPLFTKDGVNYKWTHKSFQEYFAANYICNYSGKNQEKILKIMSNEENFYKYANVLDFCYDMDYKLFSRILIYPILQEFEDFYSNTYTDSYYNQYDNKTVKIRKNLQFSFNEILIKNLNDLKYIKPSHKNLFDSVFGEKRGCNSLIHSHEFAMTFFNKRKYGLLKLLSNKNFNALGCLTQYTDTLNIDKDLKGNNIHRYERSLVENIKKNISFGEHLVNDDINNELNSSYLFKLVNDYIICVQISRKYRNISNIKFPFFDYDKCMILKSTIENEILQEENDLNFI